MTKLQAIRKFASDAAGKTVRIAQKRRFWAMDTDNYSYPRLILPEDTDTNDEEDKTFRANFVSRCPMARGFSNVTISILHEIGHYYTQEYITLEYYAEVDNTFGEAYYDIEGERVATDWAIQWLQDSDHRKMAKRFEKEYFGH